MSALDSPLEALAFNYLSFGFLTAVNNIWAWVAVITAAVSVWRIRSSSPRGERLDDSSLLTCFPSPPPQPLPSSSPLVAAEADVSSPSTSAVSVFQREGRTNGKFVLYYREEEEEEEEDDCGSDEGNDDVDSLGGGSAKLGEEGLGNGWEAAMEMRMGDLGWYRYQDLTVLDGNVVRLWDGCRRRNAAP